MASERQSARNTENFYIASFLSQFRQYNKIQNRNLLLNSELKKKYVLGKICSYLFAAVVTGGLRNTN